MNLLMFILLCILVTVASECTVCLHGRCPSRTLFYGNFNRLRSGRMVVDYNSNIIYLFDDGLDAINLNTQTRSSVPMIAPGHQIGIDYDTGDIYYYRNRKFKNIYKYQPRVNRTDIISVSIENKPPLRLFVHNKTIYFNTHKENGHDFAKGLNYLNGTIVERTNALENVTVIDVRFDKFGNMYINTGAGIYRHKKDGNADLIIEGQYLLSGDRNGDVYLFEMINRYFYKIDLNTDRLINIGAYDNADEGKLHGFWFDKDSNIILRYYASVMYYKLKASSAHCTFEFEEVRNRTRIIELNDKN